MTTFPPQFVLYRDVKGEYRWTLYAANARKIADSGEGYVNYTDCVNAIRLVKSLTQKIQINDKVIQKWHDL